MIKLAVYVEAGSEGAVLRLMRNLELGNSVHIASFVHGEESVDVEDLEIISGD